ncbi:class I SAM-dependent methyltransferase [Thalassotalea agariperforans]
MDNFISFYNEQGVVPVRQKIDNDDRIKHFNRRINLYRQLGLAPALIEGKSILEFGPGSGDNALLTSFLKPKYYKLVEGSQSGFDYISERMAKGEFHPSTIIEIEHVLIQEYQDDRRYDVVLCEGLLPGQDEPQKLLAKVAQFVKPGGVLVITTATYVSLLAEIMRRMLLPFFTADNEAEKLKKLCLFFERHLAHLQYVSRHTEDWVLDSIIHPWGKNYQFSIADAANELKDNFEIMGSSPNFYQDWRWYKELISNNNQTLTLMQQQYRAVELSFLNNNEFNHQEEITIQTKVIALITNIYDQHHDFCLGNNREQWSVLAGNLLELKDIFEQCNLQTAGAITDYLKGIEQVLSGQKIEQVDFASFESFWGRGQQYMSVVKTIKF